MGIRSKAITTHTLNFEFLTKQKFKRSSNIMKLVVVLLLVGIVTVSCLPKRGGGGGRGRRNKFCQKNDGVDWDEGCVCQDESTCDSWDDCKENCGKRSGNPVVSCTCLDGEEWTKPEKPETPCDGGRRWLKDVKSCTCDGETYEEKREMKRNCGKKGENAEQCTCSDDST